MRQARSNRRKSQLWLFPALALVMAAAVFLVLSFLNRETRLELEAPVYQYFQDQRIEYQAGAKVIPGKRHVIFEEDGVKSDGGESPIYYQERSALLLPEPMSWSDPGTGQEWQVPALSQLELDQAGSLWCESGGTRQVMSAGFLSTGTGTFLFLEQVKLLVDGETLEMPALSYCTLSEKRIWIYRYGDEAVSGREGLAERVTASAPGFEVDLTAGIYTASDGDRRLLAADPSILTEVKEK